MATSGPVEPKEPQPRRGAPRSNGSAAGGGLGAIEVRQLLGALAAFKRGEFGVRLPDEWTLTAGKVADTFNHVVDLIARLSSDLERVARAVGREGRTGQRLRTSDLSGSWGEMAGNVNQLIGELAQPVDETARVLNLTTQVRNIADVTKAVAAGDLTRKITVDVRGEIKDEFLATLSHELRTPLTPILGWAVMLRTGGLDREGVERGLTIIERNVRAQAQLIEDLLDVSRIISGNLRLEMKPIAMAPVVEAGLDSVRPSAEAKHIALVTDFAARDARVLGDPDRLQQVVWNLACNAVKFTARGGRVEVRLAEADGSVRLTVADNGKGIPPSFLPHVFDRFRQADGTSTRKYGGLGLGLAIVRHLVERHGGSVHAHSDGPDQGSVFTVQLPLLPAGRVAEDSSDAARGEDRELAIRLDGLHVMVVDDEPDLREFLTVSLKRQGAEVTAFGAAEEAYHALVGRPPDVLVSDIAMTEQDGYAFIRRVRALSPERGGEVPAAALTAHAGIEDGARALAAGFHVHLPKPIDPAQLVHTVADLARRAGELGPA